MSTDNTCSCGHPPRRHWNDGGCAVPVSTSSRSRCPCALNRAECQFHVGVLDAPEGAKRVVRHVQHLSDYLVTRAFRPRDVRWVVRPHRDSPITIMFTTHADALEFALRDWYHPNGFTSTPEVADRVARRK